MIINIQDDILKLHALGLLDRMLMDRTTKQHIMWATGAYTSLGERYEYYRGNYIGSHCMGDKNAKLGTNL